MCCCYNALLYAKVNSFLLYLYGKGCSGEMNRCLASQEIEFWNAQKQLLCSQTLHSCK